MKLKITVHGVAYEVDVEVLDPGEGFAASPSPLPAMPHGAPYQPAASGAGASRSAGAAAAGAGQPATPPGAAGPSGAPDPPGTTSASSVAAPIPGTVLEIRCKPGDALTAGQVVMIIEAMKMKTSITTPAAGKVRAVPVAAGDAVREGQILVELE